MVEIYNAVQLDANGDPTGCTGPFNRSGTCGTSCKNNLANIQKLGCCQKALSLFKDDDTHENFEDFFLHACNLGYTVSQECLADTYLDVTFHVVGVGNSSNCYQWNEFAAALQLDILLLSGGKCALDSLSVTPLRDGFSVHVN